MDGDIAPLPQLLRLAGAHDAWLVVDDAHGFGVLGAGPRRARAFRLRIGAHRLHGDARQGGRCRRRVRRGDIASVIETLRADGALLHLHDGSTAVARRGAACRACGRFATTRIGARTSCRAHRVIPASELAACRGRCCLRRRRSSRIVIGDIATTVAVSRARSLRAACWFRRSARRPCPRNGAAARLAVGRAFPSDVTDSTAALRHRGRDAMSAAAQPQAWGHAARAIATSTSTRPAPDRRSCCCTAWRCTAGCSRRSLPALAKRHRVHAVDLPGHGWSAPARARATLPALAARSTARPPTSRRR